MTGSEAVYAYAVVKGGVFVPIHFYYVVDVEFPMFEMLPYTERTYHFANTLAHLFYRFVVEVVPMVVGYYQVIDIGYVGRFVAVGAFEWFLYKRYGRGCIEYGVYKIAFAVELDKVRRVSEPYYHVGVAV